MAETDYRNYPIGSLLKDQVLEKCPVCEKAGIPDIGGEVFYHGVGLRKIGTEVTFGVIQCRLPKPS